MSYSTAYTDPSTGRTKNISLSEADCRAALANDFNEINRKYNKKYVTFERQSAQEGEWMRIKMTVNAPSHFRTSADDYNPKSCSSMAATIIVYPGYPVKGVSVCYPPNRFLASPNVFRSGKQCIDNWIPFTSSLITVAEKVIHDIIHDPVVTNYQSMADSGMERWHRAGVAAGRFPTINPRLLEAPEQVPLPARRSHRPASPSVPLPPRRRQ